MNIQEIAHNYITKIVPSDAFQSGGTCNDLSLLYEPFAEIVAKMIDEYKQRNTDNDVPYIFESYRSHALQTAYYYRGSSNIKGGNILKAGMHHFGIAVDIIDLDDKDGDGIKDKDEKVNWVDLNYGLFHKLSEKYGLVFLSWEQCHFQFIGTNQQNELRRGVYEYVRGWQHANGLVSDGIVGRLTIARAKEIYG